MKKHSFDYSRMIAISDRHLFFSAANPEEAFLLRVEETLKKSPCALILREKDMSPASYASLAKKVLTLPYDVPVILHSFPQVAKALHVTRIHLPLPLLEEMQKSGDPCLRSFSLIGTSVHSVEDAKKAVFLGANYCLAGNVFETGCKPGLKGRGLEFLRAVCQSVEIPVFGIGGINEENLPALIAAGASGGCMMSGFFSVTRKAASPSHTSPNHPRSSGTIHL